LVICLIIRRYSVTKKFFDKVQLYTQGVLVSHRCNIEQICDNLLEPNYFQLQDFITDSNWSHRDTIDITAKQTSNSLRKVKLTLIIITQTISVLFKCPFVPICHFL
jgi:hypothetical protein